MATEQQIFIVKGLYNEWMKNCLDLIESSYGLNFQSESTSAHEITLTTARLQILRLRAMNITTATARALI